MKKLLLTVVLILLGYSTAEAQTQFYGDNHFRGWNHPRIWYNQPRIWYNQPYHYRWHYYQPGIRRAPRPRLYSGVDAWAHDVRARWALQDEAKARRRAESERKRARYKEAKARKEAENSSVTHNGITYKNLDEFRKSEPYLEMMAEAEVRQLREEKRQQSKKEPWVNNPESIEHKAADEVAQKHGITMEQAWERYPVEISATMRHIRYRQQ